jgi:hypothetical protein
MFKKGLRVIILIFIVHTGVFGQSYVLDFDGSYDYVMILATNILDITANIT